MTNTMDPSRPFTIQRDEDETYRHLRERRAMMKGVLNRLEKDLASVETQCEERERVLRQDYERQWRKKNPLGSVPE